MNVNDHDMFDSSFDPYEELVNARIVINQLINAHNHMDKLMMELTKHNQSITEMLIMTKQQCDQLSDRVQLLESINEVK